MEPNDRIAEIVSLVTGVPWEVMRSKERRQKVVAARQLYSYVRRIHNRDIFRDIADDLSQDHTSVVHAVNVASDRLQTNDPLYIHHYNQIVEILIQQGLMTTQQMLALTAGDQVYHRLYGACTVVGRLKENEVVLRPNSEEGREKLLHGMKNTDPKFELFLASDYKYNLKIIDNGLSDTAKIS